MKIILDAMGGDHAPEAPGLGAVEAAKLYGAQITLVGRGEAILEALKKNGIEDARAYFQAAIDSFNRTAVAYKKISILRLRETEFPKNTLRKILRFKIDMNID